MEKQNLSEEKLMSRYRSADADDRREIANEIFSAYYRRVGGWCYRFTGDKDAATDLAQDIFAKAYRHLGSFEGNASFSTWLYTIAKNHCINAMKNRATGRMNGEEEVLSQLTDPSPAASDALEREQSLQLAKELLQNTLDDTERVVFTLHYADELPLDAITRVLRLDNPSGAKAFMVSARRKLSRAVEKLRLRGAI